MNAFTPIKAGDAADTMSIAPASGGRAGFFWRYFTGSDGRPAWPTQVAVASAKPRNFS